ncbi:MAG: tetratricopeptide repeat protein [Chloroflexota bacterium]
MKFNTLLKSKTTKLFIAVVLILGIAAGLVIGYGVWHESDTLEKALVISVIDGDTIELQGGRRVRYLGIDTPEPGEYYAAEATSRNRGLVEGKIVELQSGKRDEDEYGRLLRYVYVDGVFVNAELVAQGYATAYVFDPDDRYSQVLVQLEQYAKMKKRGLWGQSEGYQEHFEQGNIYLEQEQWDEAITEYTKAIELNPQFAGVYANRAVAYSQKDEYHLAIVDCEKAMELNASITLDTTVANAYMDRGLSYIKEGNYDKAIRDYTKAIEIDPENFFAYAFRAKAYGYKDEYDLAIADYSKAIELAPEFVLADFYSDRGWAYYHKDEYNLAIADFTKVIEFNPEDAEAYSDRGFAHYVNGFDNSDRREFQLAIADLDRALELDSTNADDYTFRAMAHAKLGDCDKAIPDYTEAIELAPDADVYNRRGSCYQDIGEIDKAIADYSRAIELDPEYSAAYYNRAGAYVELGMDAEAISDLRKFLTLSYDEERNELVRKWIEKLQSD